MASHHVVVDVELVEDGLVEQASLLVVASLVERLGILEQGEAELDESGGMGQVVARLVEAVGEPTALTFDVAKFGLDLGLRKGVIGGQVEQVFFLGVEAA